MTTDAALTYTDEQGPTEGHVRVVTSRARAHSEAANGKAGARQAGLISLLSTRGTRGLTVHEAVALLDIHHGQASGSLTNLHRASRIERLTEQRSGALVYVLPEHVAGRALEPFAARSMSSRDALAAVERVRALCDTRLVLTPAEVLDALEGA